MLRDAAPREARSNRRARARDSCDDCAGHSAMRPRHSARRAVPPPRAGVHEIDLDNSAQACVNAAAQDFAPGPRADAARARHRKIRLRDTIAQETGTVQRRVGRQCLASDLPLLVEHVSEADAGVARGRPPRGLLREEHPRPCARAGDRAAHPSSAVATATPRSASRRPLRASGLGDFTFECLDLTTAMLERGRQLAEASILFTEIIEHITSNSGRDVRTRACTMSPNSSTCSTRIPSRPAPNYSALRGRKRGDQRWVAILQEFWREMPESTSLQPAQAAATTSMSSGTGISVEGFEGIRSSTPAVLIAGFQAVHRSRRSTCTSSMTDISQPATAASTGSRARSGTSSTASTHAAARNRKLAASSRRT